MDDLITMGRDAFGPYAKLMPAIVLAVFGGIVRALQRQDCSWRSILVSGVTAAFCGSVVGLYLADLSMPEGIKSATIALSGWGCGTLLPILEDRLCRLAKRGK